MSCGLQRIGLYTDTNQNYHKEYLPDLLLDLSLYLLRLNSYYLQYSSHTARWMDGLMLILDNTGHCVKLPPEGQLARQKVEGWYARVKSRICTYYCYCSLVYCSKSDPSLILLYQAGRRNSHPPSYVVEGRPAKNLSSSRI